MANPFGITQVDVPGILQTYRAQQQQGIENAYRAQQMERQAKVDAREDAKFARAEESRAARVKVFTPDALVDPDQLPARTDGLTINKAALRDLYAIDPEGAAQIQKTVYDMDDATAKRIAARGSAMARVASVLKSVPADQRQATIAEHAPELQALGFTPQELAQADLSDAGLDRYYRGGMSMEQIIASEKDARTFAETQRHNRASEGTAAGNLAVAQGNLQVRRGALDVAKTGGTTADLLRAAGLAD